MSLPPNSASGRTLSAAASRASGAWTCVRAGAVVPGVWHHAGKVRKALGQAHPQQSAPRASPPRRGRRRVTGRPAACSDEVPEDDPKGVLALPGARRMAPHAHEEPPGLAQHLHEVFLKRLEVIDVSHLEPRQRGVGIEQSRCLGAPVRGQHFIPRQFSQCFAAPDQVALPLVGWPSRTKSSRTCAARLGRRPSSTKPYTLGPPTWSSATVSWSDCWRAQPRRHSPRLTWSRSCSRASASRRRPANPRERSRRLADDVRRPQAGTGFTHAGSNF